MMNSEVTYLLNWALENKILTVFLTITFLVWLNSTRALRSYNKLIKDLKGLMDAVESVKVGNGIETHHAVETFLAAHPENTFQYYRQLFDRNVAQQIGDHRKGFGTDLLYEVLSFDNIEATHMRESSMTFYRSLLISIGVIGTFAGLIVGIGGASEGLASTDSTTARLSLQETPFRCRLSIYYIYCRANFFYFVWHAASAKTQHYFNNSLTLFDRTKVQNCSSGK